MNYQPSQLTDIVLIGQPSHICKYLTKMMENIKNELTDTELFIYLQKIGLYCTQNKHCPVLPLLNTE